MRMSAAIPLQVLALPVTNFGAIPLVLFFGFDDTTVLRGFGDTDARVDDGVDEGYDRANDNEKG